MFVHQYNHGTSGLLASDPTGTNFLGGVCVFGSRQFTFTTGVSTLRGRGDFMASRGIAGAVAPDEATDPTTFVTCSRFTKDFFLGAPSPDDGGGHRPSDTKVKGELGDPVFVIGVTRVQDDRLELILTTFRAARAMPAKPLGSRDPCLPADES